MARYLKKEYVESIEGSPVLTAALIDRIAAARRVTFPPGTAVLIRTGWLTNWTNRKPGWALGDGVYESAVSFPPIRYRNASGRLVSPVAIK